MIRVPLGGISAGPRVLTGDAARYVARVHRLETGDAFLLFDPDARVEARATITGQSRGRVEVVIAEPTRASMVASRRIEWIHALPKGDKADAIVQDATELGASSIRFVSTSRAVVRLDAQRAANRIKRWQKIAREAARQCGRGDVPAVLEVLGWEEGLRLAPTGARFCLYERATEPLVLPSEGPLAFAVGPEGGLDESEVMLAAAAGFRAVSLGERVLRTETVCAAVLGAVMIQRRG